VLHRICTFFKTDARILLEPLHEIKAQTTNALIHPELLDYFGPQETDISSDIFPTGFFRFSRHSFVEKKPLRSGVDFVYKRDFQMLLRGMETKEAIASQGLDTNTKTREFRGFIIAQEGGLAMLAFAILMNFGPIIADYCAPTRPFRDGVASCLSKSLIGKLSPSKLIAFSYSDVK